MFSFVFFFLLSPIVGIGECESMFDVFLPLFCAFCSDLSFFILIFTDFYILIFTDFKCVI